MEKHSWQLLLTSKIVAPFWMHLSCISGINYYVEIYTSAIF